MPPAKRSTSTRSRSSTSAFKPPAALANLNKSIDAAEKALTQLSKHAGRDVSRGSQDLYKNLKTFVTTARRDSGKFARAIQKDFDQAQKTMAKGTTTGTSRRTARKSTAAKTSRTSTAARSTRAAAKKTTAKSTRRTTARRTAKRSG